MTILTLLRRAEHEALSGVTLSGSVLDLGGEKGAGYLSYIKGSFTTTAVNLDSQNPDVIHDLEKPLPIPDASYDHVLLINVLEHIYDYKNLLKEAARVLKPGGSLVVVVPFLFPVHPSPGDYRRFTDEALRRELEALALSDVRIEPLGSGVFAARYVMLDRLLPGFLRAARYYLCGVFVPYLDSTFTRLACVLGKQYQPSDYALGYLAVAQKRA
jgi:SAM-dependent methyltransferase